MTECGYFPSSEAPARRAGRTGPDGRAGGIHDEPVPIDVFDFYRTKVLPRLAQEPPLA